MIREPYNLNPYNSTMDVTENPTFSFTFGGDALSRAQVMIAKSNSDGTPLFISGVSEDDISSSYCPGIRNNDFVSISVDSLKSKLSNNRDYIWKLRLIENNAGFHNWCHFSNRHLLKEDPVLISKEEYTRFFVNPVLDKYVRPDTTYSNYDEITKKLQNFFQAIVFFQNNYYKVLGVKEAEDGENVELILHSSLEGEYGINDSFLLFTNVDVNTKQNTYATQTVKTGSAIGSETETGIVLTKGIPYDMSKVFKFESGVFTALAEHGKLYASITDYVIMNDNAKIYSIDAETVIVDIPSSHDLTKGFQASAALVLESMPCQITRVDALSSEDPSLAGYYRFTCEKNKDFVATKNDIVNYEIRGWDCTIEDYQDILVEVQKKAYSYQAQRETDNYENVIFAIGVDELFKQRIIAYEQWEYATGDLKGFIYYSDFHLYHTPLGITPGTTFKITSNFYDSSWYYFQARKKPSASITCFNGIESGDKIIISQRISTFQGFYNGNGVDTVKTHRWVISNSEGIIYDSGAIYDGDLVFRYEDFSEGGDYLITLEIISQSKEVCSTSLQLCVDPMVENTTSKGLEAEILDSYQAIKLTWPGLLVTNSKITLDCTIATDEASNPYLHIPKNNYILFDTIGADDFTIGPPALGKGHHFKMRLAINDDLQFYNGDIFILRNSKTGDFISLYKEGSKILFKTPSSSKSILGGELLTPELGLQKEWSPKKGSDYQWLNNGVYEKDTDPFWTETFTNTNIYIWDIAFDIDEKYIMITLGNTTTGGSTTTTITHQLYTSFDNIYFNGDINLYYFAYGIGESNAWAWGSDNGGVPQWDSQLSLDVQFIFKPNGEDFVSNPQVGSNEQSNIAPIKEYVIYRQYPNQQKKKLGNFALRDELIGLDSYSFVDWTCQNHLTPTYEVVPIDIKGSAGLPFTITVEETSEWYYWTFMSLTKGEAGHYYPSEIWDLYLNLAAGSYVQNLTKTYHQGFSMNPKVSLGPSNYITTSLQGLLIDVKPIKHPENGKQLDTYKITYADSHKVEKWRQFVYSNDLVLVKDIAGHVFIASLSNPQYTINDVGVITAEVSFDITQIGDINDYQIFTSSAAPKEDGYGIL